MSTRALRNLGKKAAFAAFDHFAPKIAGRVSARVDKALGLVPTEHRAQVTTASAAAVEAARGARGSLERGECPGAYAQAAAARAFATVAAVEARNSGGGTRAKAEADRAVSAARRASTAVDGACVVVPRRLAGRQVPPALPAAESPAPAQIAGWRGFGWARKSKPVRKGKR